MKSSCGWLKASLISTNVLFKRIYQILLNDTTEWEIYTSIYQTNIGWKLCASTKGLGKTSDKGQWLQEQCKYSLCRYISKGITPVGIRLKTTVRTKRGRKIIKKAERDLLQARVKSINSLLDNNTKQKDRCRSQLASIYLPLQCFKCQELTR